MVTKLQIQFGKPVHGWLPVQMSTASEDLSFIASYIPYNSLFELTTALASLINTPDAYSLARWNTEPIEFHFLFAANGESAELKVVKQLDNRKINGEETTVFAVQGTRKDIATPMWRALRNLESRWKDVDRTNWQHDFPSREVEELGKLVKSI